MSRPISRRGMLKQAATGATALAFGVTPGAAARAATPIRRNWLITLNTSTSGLVCAQLAGLIGQAALTEVAGDNTLSPDNVCMVVDADLGDPITSGERKVYALLQAESTATNNTAPDDSTNQLQLTFVRPNATFDDLELVPAADVGGKEIIYSYPDREYMHLWSQSDFRRDMQLVDLSASAISVTLDSAYNGGSQVGVDNTNVEWRLTDDKFFRVTDSDGSDKILEVAAAAAGDELSVNAPGGITLVGDVDGSTYNATWNGVEVGGAAGQVATASGDLTLAGADDILFTTVRETALPIDDATAGAISALDGGPHASVAAAIKYAIEHGKVTFGVSVLSSNYARDANIPGGAGGLNIASPHSIDMNTPSGVDTIIIWNGQVKLGGNGTTNNDVYAGTSPEDGDIKVDEPDGAKNGDVFIAMQFSV